MATCPGEDPPPATQNRTVMINEWNMWEVQYSSVAVSTVAAVN